MAAIVMAGLALFGAGTARAGSPVVEFLVQPSSTQAGGHPNLRTAFVAENYFTQGLFGTCNCQDPKNVTVHLPAGVTGVPDAMPKCNDAEFGNIQCSPDSQVGILRVGLNEEAFDREGSTFLGNLGVYNLVPHSGQAALLGANVTALGSPIYFEFSPRTNGDYGLDVRTDNIAHPLAALRWADLEVWGVPADPVNDKDRVRIGCKIFGEKDCGGETTSAPLRPFTLNPTTCGEALTASIDVVSYDREETHASTTYPATTGCDQLGFNPSLFAEPTAASTDSPSGAEVDLRVPQDLSPYSPSASGIRNAVVDLPDGFSINTNAADGKEACSDVEARFGTREQARCPEAAKIGTLTVTTATLPGPLHGFLYLGEPKPGERYRAIIVADGFNVHVKLPGTIIPDPVSGRVRILFKDLPQFPFSEFNMHVFGAERGSLATPTRCGTYPVRSTFTPWDGFLSDQSSVQYFTLGSGPDGSACPGGARPFAPALEAGVTDKTSGKHSPFVLRLSREDGDQSLSRLDVGLPSGLAATLRGVPYCPEAAMVRAADPGYSGVSEVAAPSCPAASEVGSVTAGAGAGSRPVYVRGKAYLAGPYKGAPLSFFVVIPAVSGPYDLGNVAVRTAIYVDPVTARVSAVSDPFPQIIGGIPLRARFVQINLDRADFTLNPTNCDPFFVDATVFGDEGAQVSRPTNFQVVNCADLDYGPKLNIELSGGLRRRGHPAIQARLRTGAAEANTRLVQVTLPKGELLDNAHIDTICTRVQFAARACPKGSRIGYAEARSPLLDEPLKGGVYLRSSNHALPDMVVDLHGQIHIETAARIKSVNGRLRTTFATVPDVPIGFFSLNLQGGRKGLLQNSEGLCGAHKKATVLMLGQNGRRAKSRVSLNSACRIRHRSRVGHGDVSRNRKSS